MLAVSAAKFQVNQWCTKSLESFDPFLLLPAQTKLQKMGSKFEGFLWPIRLSNLRGIRNAQKRNPAKAISFRPIFLHAYAVNWLGQTLVFDKLIHKPTHLCSSLLALI